MTKKIQNKGFLVLLLIAVCISIGYPIINHFYIKPLRWKQGIINGLEQKLLKKNILDENRIKFSNCIYDKFINKYGSIDKFPNKESYTNQDKIDLVLCTVENLISDSTERKWIIQNMDSIINKK
jgi:hypothetical protein